MKIIKKCLSNTGRVPRYGKMVLSMKVTGGTEWPKDKVISTMPTVMFIQESFTRIEPMDLGFMFTRTVKHMKAFGGTICRTVQVKRSWRTAPSTMACSRTARSGAREPTSGPTTRSTPETGSTTTSKEKVSTDGLMDGSTTDNGKKINFMERAFTLGPTEENMKVNIRMIRSMVSVPTTGPTAKLTKANGSTASNTAKPDSQTQKEEAN